MKRKYSLFALSVALLAVFACGKHDPNAVRSDIIEVFDSPDCKKALERDWISVQGGTKTYYVRSERAFEAKWQDSGDRWGRVGAPVRVRAGLWKVDVSADPISGRTPVTGESLYQKRYGVVLFTVASRHLGNYFKVEQGMDCRLNCDFSWLGGSAEPNAVFKDLPIARWTVAQKNYGFTSTVLPGQEQAWVFSKEGYVKLGSDERIGADFITPRLPELMNDTLLVVSFKATVQYGDVLPDFSGGTEPVLPLRVHKQHTASEGTDLNTLTVRVSGGGQLRDAVPSVTFQDIRPYDPASAAYPMDIFDGKNYLVFIEGTENNPITVNTLIHFEAGDQSGAAMEACNRIFIDDLCIYRVSSLLDEDIFLLNGGSGKDIVL